MVDPSPLFTCPNCGGHVLVVQHQWVRHDLVTSTLPCSCDLGQDAAERKVWDAKLIEERGPVLEDHTWDYESEEETTYDEDEVSCDVICQECYDQADESGWESEIDESESQYAYYHGHEYGVVCGGCGRSVKVGWEGASMTDSNAPGGPVWLADDTDPDAEVASMG